MLAFCFLSDSSFGFLLSSANLQHCTTKELIDMFSSVATFSKRFNRFSSTLKVLLIYRVFSTVKVSFILSRIIQSY